MKRCKFASVNVAVLILCLAGLISSPLFAQSSGASVQGTVTDASGALVPRVQLTLVNEATNIKQVQASDERGHYLFVLIPPGSYSLTAGAPGFQTVIRSKIELQVAQQAAIDVRLSVGDVRTQVEVLAETPRLDAVSATLGRVVDNRSLLDMPLNTRDPMALAGLTPGVVGSTGNTGTNFISSGSRNSNSDVLMDGVTLTTKQYNDNILTMAFRPTVEMVQEFKVETNSFSAQYGQTGGTVVNVVSKSGTNELHGSLFEFHRNSTINANGWFSNKAGRAIIPFRRNQFGGSAGGPVWIPRVYNGKNRTFFFFAYEGNKQTTMGTSTASVPTLLEKQGDFSQTMDSKGRQMTIYDPFDVRKDPVTGNWIRAPFALNSIPISRWDPVAKNVVAYYPDPTSPGNAFTHLNNLFQAGARPSNGYQYNIKIDNQISEAQRLSARFSRTTQLSTSPNLWGNVMGTSGNQSHPTGFSTSLDYIKILSPTTILNLRWGISRLGTFNDLGVRDINEQKLGFTTSFGLGTPPVFQPVGYSSVGPSYWSLMRLGEDTNHLVIGLTKVMGIHQLKFGGESRLMRTNHGQPGVPFAQFYFDQYTTQQNPFKPDSLQGNAIASMLLGWGNETGGPYYQGLRNEGPGAFSYSEHGAYAEDQIQVTRRLTATLGLRWELAVPRTDRYNRVAWLDLNAKSPFAVPAFPDLRAGLVFGDDKQRRPYNTSWNDFAPRVNLAYQFSREMVVRAGYGIYYGQSGTGPNSGLPWGYAVWLPWTASLDGGVTQFAALRNPYPGGVPQPTGNKLGLATGVGGAMIADLRGWATKPYYQQWSLSIQRQLPANSVAEIAYSANQGVHLYNDQMAGLNRIDPKNYALGDSLNDMVPNPFSGVITDRTSFLSQPTVQRIQLLRPYPQFGGLLTSIYGGFQGAPGPPSATSIYHGVQFKFSKRISHGLSVSTHYTISKMIDNSSLSGGNLTSWGGFSYIQSYNDLRLERSVSLFDQTHRWVADFAYELPFGRGKALGTSWNRVVDGFLGRWQLNGIFEYHSGFPLTTALQGGVLPDATQRPNLISDPKLSGSVESRLNLYLNPDAFSRPARYMLGTAPRNLSSVRAPSFKNFDCSIFKNLSLSGDGKRYLQLRLEAFNATNTPIFGAPNMTWGSTSFGVISAQANSPRELQIAGKIYF